MIERFDLTHRLPFSFPHYDNLREIEEEIDGLDVDTLNIFDHMKQFFMTYFKDLLEPDELKIIHFFEGVITLDEIGLTKENGAYFLRLVKIIDLALICQTRISRSKLQFPNTSEPIRTRILELLSLQTQDVYTLAVDPKKLTSDYLKNPAHWIPERIGFYASRIIPQEFVRMIALSKRLNQPAARIIALRGSTASGKTTYASRHWPEALDEKGELSGCLNPDQMKAILKGGRLTNVQVHEEVARGPLSLYKEAILKQNRYSIIVDARLSSDLDFEAILGKRRVTLIDLEVPLSTSLERVLKRDPYGKEPCVFPTAVKMGWIEARRSRPAIIMRAILCPLVDHYRLYSNQELVAEKINKTLHVHSKAELAECCRVPDEEEMEKEYHPLSEALACHATGSLSFVHDERFGTVSLEPFTGEWLSDYPQLIEHLRCEQKLHVRGTDELGRGLHWPTNKFAWKWNSRFNPEACFQMRLGYFILPASMARAAKTLSNEVLEQLKKGSGYRFFVHPESYPLYQHLLDQYPFVKPEDSPFIATPTSSYRSLAVRREGSRPFIVKLLQEDITYNFDYLPEQDDLLIFRETFGLMLNDTGMIVREFPDALLQGKCQIYSFSAVMSAERIKEGKPPLIYDIMEKTIRKGIVKSSHEFVKRYFIHGAWNALKTLVFEEGLSLPLHGQNFCLVVDREGIPSGFALRDLSDIHRRKRYLETYSWFYRYHVFAKLMNVITFALDEYIPPRSPIQMGNRKPLQERNVNRYVRCQISTQALEELSLTLADYQELLETLDQHYLSLFSRYFSIQLDQIPAAEVGSAGERALQLLNKRVWDSRKAIDKSW